MRNPYDILEISPLATNDEVKSAYRALSRKYHPDANINNPNKDEAEERFKEVQQAYEEIMDARENGQDITTEEEYDASEEEIKRDNESGFYGHWRYEKDEVERDRAYKMTANSMILSEEYREAIEILSNVKARDAEWCYLNAVANIGLRRNVTAMEYAQKAVNMDPVNTRYRELLEQLEGKNGWYRMKVSSYMYLNLEKDTCCRIGKSALCCGVYSAPVLCFAGSLCMLSRM